MSLARIFMIRGEKIPKSAAMRTAEKVTRTCTSSKGVIPVSKRAFPAVPEEAHIKAAAMMHIYPFVACIWGDFTFLFSQILCDKFF